LSQVTTRRCQSDACREPIVVIDHGRPYPVAGVVVLCFEPMKVRCHCGHVSIWEKATAT
jgi:hypothetical protein